MEYKLNLNELQNATKSIKIGELTTDVINVLGLNSKPRNIYMWPDRLIHCEKHKADFSSEQEYYESMENIPEIIKNPDYVGLHSNNKGFFYIKRLNNNCLVGITMDSLLFRSMYPITEGKLNSYIQKGKVFPLK